MIPRIIHYCWFGNNPKSLLIKKCIKSWKKICPDFKIIEWNESNFDINSSPLYVQQAYRSKKWAFVSDYVRLWAVFNYGGIYFDTDVQLIKSIDFLLKEKGFFCFEDEKYIATGLGFGTSEKEEIIKKLITPYESISFFNNDETSDTTTCLIRNEPIFLKYDLKQNGQTQYLSNGMKVFDRSYFCPKEFHSGYLSSFTNNTIAIHHYAASWHTPKQKFKNYIKKIIKRIKNVYERIK